MRFVLTADDTTGALETAAACADAGWSAAVVPHHSTSSAGDAGLASEGTAFHGTASHGTASHGTASVMVIDLRSRHVVSAEAAERVARVVRASPLVAHKIDSTLRGNWPAEVGALTDSGRVAVIVPSYPGAGRVCVGGIVTEHGVPVDRGAHADDPRSPVRSARPAESIPGSVELDGAVALRAWLAAASPGAAAVVDAIDDRSIGAIVAAVRGAARNDVVVVGTAGVLGEMFAAPATLAAVGTPSLAGRALARPVLVVCGSVHPTAQAQVAAVRDAGWPDVHLLVTPASRSGDPAHVVAQLAAEARLMIDRLGIATLIVVGGDTAEALIADAAVHVHGSLGVGIASGTVDIAGRSVAIVSKPGAFGDATTVTRLLDVEQMATGHERSVRPTYAETRSNT